MLYIIRHGQTRMNQEKVLQGRSDHPLDDKGMVQARETGEWFEGKGIRFDRVYSSPLSRAVQTALLVMRQEEDPLPVITDERLIEMDYGPYEGMSLSDPAPEILTFFRDFKNNPAPEGMEPLSEVVKRAGDFLEEIKQLAEQETILVSTHAIAMKGLLEYLTPDSDGSYWSKYIGNCSVYVSEVKDGAYSVPEEMEIA